MKKKLLAVLGILAVSGIVWAATTQFTETLPPVSPQGAVPVSNGYSWSLSSNSQGQASPLTLPIGTSTYINALQATTTGQIIFCTSCVSMGLNGQGICYSTGSTTTGQFVSVSSATTLTACK